jgi:predicted patatin/cPLA2 family phospholipase
MSTTIYGVNPVNTIELLKERARRWRKGNPTADGRKVALIVEGGAMRGVISCAALMSLQDLGMTAVFDEVYGASAGAANAAYFLAGQAAYATTIYYQKINNTRFIRRLWHRKVVDIDDLFDSVIGGDRPLRVDRVLASQSRFFITITDACSGEAFLVEAQSSVTPLLTLLKASAAMPLLYNGLVNVEGRDCCDGGLINPLPVLEAIESGCTDLFVLSTRPATFRDSVPSLLEQRLFDMRCARGNAQLLKAYCNSHIRENAVREIVLGYQEIPAGINIATICPEETDPRVDRTTRHTETLKAAAIVSAKRIFHAFDHAIEDVIEVLRPFPPVEPEPETLTSQSDDSTLAAA